jgi:hypothetical protein
MTCFANMDLRQKYMAAALKKTTEVKAMVIPNVTQFDNIRLAMSQSVSRSRGSFSSTDHSISNS